ncbi:hypothetical protein AX16_000075 [Volvariella volvacea WC 439]|nr:hypothetical protein AX16_000075 [Volvariella volvacea WC 439]
MPGMQNATIRSSVRPATGLEACRSVAGTDRHVLFSPSAGDRTFPSLCHCTLGHAILVSPRPPRAPLLIDSSTYTPESSIQLPSSPPLDTTSSSTTTQSKATAAPTMGKKINIPPGFYWCLTQLPSLILPPTLVLLANKIAASFWGTAIPLWALIVALFLSFPAVLFVQVQYSDWVNRREAARLGAVIAPHVPSKLPGGVSFLLESIKNYKTGYPGEQFVDWGKQYGNTFILRILFEDRLFTTEPEYIKAVLATQFEGFGKGPWFIRQMDSLLGTGVFNSDGEMWKFHRAMTRPFFSKDRISHFDIFDRHAMDALSQLSARLKEGYPVDIQDLVSRFTMDSATEFLFGKDVKSLSAGLVYPHYAPSSLRLASQDHPATIFTQAFQQAQDYSAVRGRWGKHWPLPEFFQDAVKSKMQAVEDYIEPILADAIARRNEQLKDVSSAEKGVQGGDKEVGEDETLLDHLIKYTDDEKVLRDETLNILLAGRDTTANTLTFATYALAENPHVLAKLREEILTKIGPTRRPTFEDMRELKYLRAFINEVLRLYPAVPFNIRTTNKAILLPPLTPGEKPFYVPANTRVPYSVFVMHRRKDLWGPDADKFDPDRFLDERLKKYLTPNPFIFLPFNAGPRICLGQQFAYHETSFFLIRLLQNFRKIELAPEGHPEGTLPPPEWKGQPGTKGTDRVRIKAHLTMYALGGCWVRMEEETMYNTIIGPRVY